VAKRASKKPKASKQSKKTSAKRQSSSPKSVSKAAGGGANKKSRPSKSSARKKSVLTKKELAEFREMLLARRRDLVGDMSGIQAGALRGRQGGSGELSNMPTHLADIGSDNYEQEFTMGLLESERVLLQEIDEALQRIEDGTYGICQGTGKPISKARLRARPWAKYCIEYARMLEKGLVRPGEPVEVEE